MKNILIITAHPSENGFTHKIAKKYFDIRKKLGDQVDIINLYKTKYKQNFFSFENKQYKNKLTREQKYFQKKIFLADRLVFIFPIWTGDAPSILKNWFDWNITPRFAFTYSHGMVKGLLKGREVCVITTLGGSVFLYKIFGLYGAIKTIWKRFRIGFSGMNLKKMYMFGGFDTGFVKRDKILKKIEKIALK
ncbi:NAD(P)H-dependent oxidoreductase [archaeon]|nr:NAD(P)H-dependent oxidoreductase [archaeon]